MTIREIICDAGVSTLREFMCIQPSIGTVIGIVINSELIMVTEDPIINVVEYSDKVAIIEDDKIILVEIDDVIKITEEDEDKVDVIC